MVGAATALFVALILGCSTPQSRYKVLSLFFDGVPDPDAQAKAALRGRKNNAGQTVYLHKPYAERPPKCDACHQNTSDIFARAKVSPEVCGKCHAAVQHEHRITHGPVASQLCLYCHSPHHSIYPHLLKLPMPKLCMQCHEPGTLSTKEPQHSDPKADCISCHSGHGGDDRRFLKPMPATAPTTMPASGSGVAR
jgi:predicted CXXCH cytochrome family protein